MVDKIEASGLCVVKKMFYEKDGQIQ